MTLGRRSCPPMDLAAFRMKDVEVDRTDAAGRPVYRHRRSLRARFARLAAWWAEAWARANPHNQRPSDRA